MRGTSKAIFGISLAAFTILSSAVPSPNEINIHIRINNAPLKLHDTLHVEGNPVIINFDDLEPGYSPGNYSGLEWSNSIRVSAAKEFTASPPNAVLVSQYARSGVQNHPCFKTTPKSPYRTFDLQEFFIAPAYEPNASPRVEFNVTVVGFGAREEQVNVQQFTVGGAKAGEVVYPVAVRPKGMTRVAKVEISLTSQIAPTGAAFEPPYYLDDIKLVWRTEEPRFSGNGQVMEGKTLGV